MCVCTYVYVLFTNVCDVAAVSAMLAARGDGFVVVGGREGEVVEVGGVDVAGKCLKSTLRM